MKAKTIKEDLNFDDSHNAIAGWYQAYHGDPNFEKTIVVKEPFEIRFDKESEMARLVFLLNKYRIPFEEVETVSEGILKFSDGMEFDTSGPLRTEERDDGWYVLGQGILVPVDSDEEGKDYISRVSHLSKD